MYLLSREEREEIHEFIEEQLRKGYIYIRLSKPPQTALVFFVEFIFDFRHYRKFQY